MDDDLVANFVAITGASEQVARQLLEMTNGDIEQAAVLFYDTDMAETLARQPAAAPAAASHAASASRATASGAGAGSAGRTASSSRSRSRPRRARPAIGHEDQDGVIHLDDSDDNGDVDFEDVDDDDADDADNFQDAEDSQMSDAAEAETVARTAQEEEDEAMAKRLQEEMYAEPSGADADGIRAPMGRTTEVLVEPSYGGGDGGYGGNFSESVFEEMRRRRQQTRGPPNPFNQVWDDDASLPGLGAQPSAAPQPTSRQARLADLFRPPYDLMEHMSWDEARSVGKSEKRWILANIQDMADFQCQALNRDIWKDEAIRQLVQENFIFLQYSKDDPGAESYIQYYMPGGQHENADNYPHVGIIDPRTGEQVKVWSGRPFPSALDFHAQLAEFLDRYSLDLAKKNPVQRSKPQQVVKDVGRMTEDEMLEMALRNSLETAGAGASGEGAASGGGSGTASRPSVQDPDELTGTPAPGGDKGKGKATADEAEAEAASDAANGAGNEASAAFARIASDRPHEEPANNPAATTRIQFRHPTGRVIRRFAVDDPVVRIYEWLKAAPLEGKEGLEFELKVVPQGHDLIEDLDKTVEEAGLKQATVMIEFIG